METSFPLVVPTIVLHSQLMRSPGTESGETYGTLTLELRTAKFRFTTTHGIGITSNSTALAITYTGYL